MFRTGSALSRFAFIGVFSTTMLGCGASSSPGTDAVSTEQLSQFHPTPNDLRLVSGMRIAFGHQSVGADIIAGLVTLSNEGNAPIFVVESTSATNRPAIQHFLVGTNGDPESKLTDFANVMVTGVGGSVDVAMLKLCYIDFNQRTDPAQLARKYISEIDSLSARFPATTFVAVTVPLTTVQKGPKAIVKRILGRLPAGYLENAQRQVFNDVLREHYAGSNRMFDIAALESDNGKHAVDIDGKHVPVLNPTLTYDGGHLNDAGKRLVAGALIRQLATFSKQPPVAKE